MTQLRDDLIAVEVPEGASNFKIEPHLVRNAIVERDEIKLVWESSQITHNWVILPPGTWKLLCTTREAQDKDTICLKGESIIGLSNLPELLTSKGLDVNKNHVLLKKK